MSEINSNKTLGKHGSHGNDSSNDSIERAKNFVIPKKIEINAFNKYYQDDYHDEDYFRNLSNTDTSNDVCEDEGFVDFSVFAEGLNNGNQSSASLTDWTDYYYDFHGDDQPIVASKSNVQVDQMDFNNMNQSETVENTEFNPVLSEDEMETKNVIQSDSVLPFFDEDAHSNCETVESIHERDEQNADEGLPNMGSQEISDETETITLKKEKVPHTRERL